MTGRRGSAPEPWARSSTGASRGQDGTGEASAPAGVQRTGGTAHRQGTKQDSPTHCTASTALLQQRGQGVTGMATGRTRACHTIAGTSLPCQGKPHSKAPSHRECKGEVPPRAMVAGVVIHTQARPGQACTGIYLTLRTEHFSTDIGNKEQNSK